MAGVVQHSDYKADPWGRLNRTVRFVLHTTYGDTSTAEAACAAVRRIHDRVHGVDAVTGRAYSAHDPDLLLWIHAVEVHSAVFVVPQLRGPARRRGRRPVRRRDGARRRAPRPAVRHGPALDGRAPRVPARRRGASAHAGRPGEHAPDPLAADAVAAAPAVGAPGKRGRRVPAPVRAPDVRPAVVRARVACRYEPPCSASRRFLNVLPIEAPEIREAKNRLEAAA